MPSKTPKFNQTLKGILNNLRPHQRECKECGEEFEIMAKDIEFYKKLQVPPPTLCPECRYRRRHGCRISFLPIFYKKTCSAPEHNEKVISFYSEKNPIKIYDEGYYLSDEWDATEFSTNIDENNFFSQFKNFVINIPHRALFRDYKSINSDYTLTTLDIKNCYYTTGPYLSEKIYYSYLPIRSRECINTAEATDSERCFDSVNLNKSYGCIFCVNSSDCMESSFLYDCKNCNNCFMSSNLRNKSYCFKNKQLSKEEYKRKIKKINLGKRSIYEQYKKEFENVIDASIKKNVNNSKVIDCLGDNIHNSKNCFVCFLVIDNSENNRYVAVSAGITNSMDSIGVASSSYLYESIDITRGDSIRFSTMCRNVMNVEYSSECNNCENCFACFGLKNKKCHIFNKSYSEEEYWQKVDELKTKMLERGEYGEFFPLKDSSFPYQDSNAQIEFPLTEEEIKAKGWHWQDEVKSDIDFTKITAVEAEDIPDDIKDITNDILKTPVICERTGKPFKITPFELEFYRKMNVPLPVIHPLERAKDLFKYKREYKLYQITCAKCSQKIQTVYNPVKMKNIYCEKCYQQKVN